VSGFVNIEKKIKTGLAPLGIKLVTYMSVASTNAEAKAYAADTADREPVLFLAREQSAGRGRLGRSFHSRRDGGIYMTLLYFTREALCSAVTVTTAAAVAAATSIEEIAGLHVGIKWVNDIYNERGKVAGILVETVPVSDGYAIVVGIGINVGDDDFPADLSGIAASLGNLNDDTRANLTVKICEKLLCHAADHTSREYMTEYRRLFILRDKTIDMFVSGEHILRGVVSGVDDNGALQVQPLGESEIKCFSSGEITLRVVDN